MKLFVDAGNTRIKWQLRDGPDVAAGGAGVLSDSALFAGCGAHADDLTRVCVSTVRSEEDRAALLVALEQLTQVPVQFYWTRPEWRGLRCAYTDYRALGADRWHALVGAWQLTRGACAVVDAGSALTIDFLAPEGRHLGGYILPGRQMMLRSLRQDAARIDFATDPRNRSTSPGQSTAACVHNGLDWLADAVAGRLHSDCRSHGIDHVFITGGDAPLLSSAGLRAESRPDLVIEGLMAVADEES